MTDRAEELRCVIADLCEQVRERDAEIERLRDALLRAKQWGGMGKSWHSGVAMDLMAWIDADMKGPLPPLPDYLPANDGGKRR